MAIYDVIAAAQLLVKTNVTSISSAPTYPKWSTPGDFVICEAWPTNIRISSESAGMKLTLFDIHMELTIPLGALSEETHKQISTWPEAIAEVFLDNPTISGTCSTWEGEFTAQLAYSRIADIAVLGWVINIPNIKINGSH